MVSVVIHTPVRPGTLYKIIGKIISITEKVSFKDLSTKPSLLFEKYGKIVIIVSK